jgi:hypothetical protein
MVQLGIQTLEDTTVSQFAVGNGYYNPNGGDDLMEIFETSLKEKHLYDVLPLAGVRDGEVVLSADTIKKYAVIATNTHSNKQNVLGIIAKDSDVLYPEDAIRDIAKSIPLPVRSLVLSPNADKMIVEFNLPEMNIMGDFVQQSLVVFSNILRGDGSGAMLWHLPMRCINQIPVMQMHKSNGWSTSKFGRIKFEDIMARAGQFVKFAPQKMEELYGLMNKTVISDSQFSNLLHQLYPYPILPQAKVTDEGTDFYERYVTWKKKRAEVESVHNTVQEIIHNGNGTHTTAQTSNMSLYAYVQAVSEFESKAGNIAPERMINQMIGGMRSKKIGSAFEQALTVIKKPELTNVKVRKFSDS